MATARTQDVVFNSYIGYDYSLSLDSKLGCNLANTPIITTYPTAPTASKGTYIFADNGSTKLLTAGGTNDKASISLDICSSTLAPYNVLYANKMGKLLGNMSAITDGHNVAKVTEISKSKKFTTYDKDYIAFVNWDMTNADIIRQKLKRKLQTRKL